MSIEHPKVAAISDLVTLTFPMFSSLLKMTFVTTAISFSYCFLYLDSTLMLTGFFSCSMSLLSSFRRLYSSVISGSMSSRFGIMKSIMVFGRLRSMFSMMSLVISFFLRSMLSYILLADLSPHGSSLLQFLLFLWTITLACVSVL